MRTVIVGPPPPEVLAMIESRRRTGADRFDEVWEGDLHMNPAPRTRHSKLGIRLGHLIDSLSEPRGLVTYGEVNLGVPGDYRIPDLTVLREEVDELYVPTAALVVEILSPHDETLEKLPFYAERGVEEAVIVDPVERTVVWLRSDRAGWSPVDRSELLGVTVVDVTAEIDWPLVGSPPAPPPPDRPGTPG